MPTWLILRFVELSRNLALSSIKMRQQNIIVPGTDCRDGGRGGEGGDLLLRVQGWSMIGIMENEMETTIVYWGLYGDNGKENGSHYSILWP